MVHQGYIEPHNAVGIYSADGHATIYCSTQGTFVVRSLCSAVLGIPEGKIKVVPAEIGGGFGGKLPFTSSHFRCCSRRRLGIR